MSDLDRLFYWRGIASDYNNYRGEHIHVPLENRTNLLKAMGVDVSTAESIAREAYLLDVKPWERWLRELSITPSGNDAFFEINIAPHHIDTRMCWVLEDELGAFVSSGEFLPSDVEETGEYLFEDTRYSRRKVPIGSLQANYYSLSVSVDNVAEKAVLAAVPEQSFQPQWVAENKHVWGVIIQLYTLRSSRNWGIGDFTDLQNLIIRLAGFGADVIGLNPLHALLPQLDSYYSPYSPSDRRFINPLYIDPTKITKDLEGVDNLELAALRALDYVDYQRVRDCKYRVFQTWFDSFIGLEAQLPSRRYLDFLIFLRASDDSIFDFARYEARHQRWKGARYVLDVDISLSALRAVLTEEKPVFSNEQHSVLFHCYLQWLASEQLAVCQNVARGVGMKVGLIRDLAVGADGGGAEVSTNQKLFCREAAIGAPPDPFAQTGQNWGLPPAVPSEMRITGFTHFRQLLRSNMAHCGALRIDHAMSLMRLWWCPPGHTADFGAYVYYPFHETLGLLTLESHLAHCQIIGEDLGVVPDEFREALRHKKIFTNKVFYFEKIFHDRLKHPRDYDTQALAMVNNHDLPTLVSWWNGTDLALRNTLNLLEEGVDYSDVCAEREKDKAYLMALLSEEKLCPDSWHDRSLDEEADNALIGSILLLASRATSQIFVLQLEDLLMMDEPVNVPGTFKEHKNWRRKLSHTIDDIFANTDICDVLSGVNSQRKRQIK